MTRYRVLRNTPDGLTAEYSIAKSTHEGDPSYWSRLTVTTQEIAKRNRYANVKTLEDTRVKLGDGECDYINASLVRTGEDESAIVAQGPLRETCGEFWQMVMENAVPLVVMLTNFEDGNKEKCFPYFPQNVEKKKFGEYEVECLGVDVPVKGWTRRMLVVSKDAATQNVTHLHCSEWPDFGRIHKAQMMGLRFGLDTMREARRDFPGKVPLIHCSAGIGRSGTFLALDALLGAVAKDRWDLVDPLNVVLSLRHQRPGMVQTEEQYTMIYDVLVAMLEGRE